MARRKNDVQAEKALVRAFHDALDPSTPATIEHEISRFVSPGWLWRGMHPFHQQRGPAAVARVFWTPFRNALKAGENRPPDGSGRWVVQMGYFLELLDRPLFGRRPTQRILMLRLAAFNRGRPGDFPRAEIRKDDRQLPRDALGPSCAARARVSPWAR